jgi:glycerol-3-phosphate acyltransferase PlsX
MIFFIIACTWRQVFAIFDLISNYQTRSFMATKIALDAMGGDHAPGEIIRGAVRATEQYPNLEITLLGDQAEIENELKKCQSHFPFEIIHTDQWVTMDEDPREAINSKPRASINLGAELVNQNLVDGLVSAGNTGATILAAAKHIPVIEGIERTALATVYPTAKFEKNKSGFALMLDVGATLKCTPKQLVHFAFMGSFYLSEVMTINQPKIGLLNIGEEKTKGGDILKHTYELLSKAEELNFIGNIEGKDIPKGIADVVVTEGFLGNVVLKMLEGIAEVVKETGKYAFNKKLSWKIAMTILSPGIRKLRKRTDYSEYGGAPILGFQKLAIKAHGRSNAKAIANAIRVAAESSQQDICKKIEDSIGRFNLKYAADLV